MPLDFVVETLAGIFAARAERGVEERVNSLRYCAPAVAAAWKRRRELVAPAHREVAPPFDVAERLRALARALPADWPPARELGSRLAGLTGEVPSVEAALGDLDRHMIRLALDGLDAGELAELEAAVQARLAELRPGMATTDLDRATERLTARLVRRRLALPVLSLFGSD